MTKTLTASALTSYCHVYLSFVSQLIEHSNNVKSDCPLAEPKSVLGGPIWKIRSDNKHQDGWRIDVMILFKTKVLPSIEH